MKAKKSLGQIFLINKDKIRKIVANLDLQKNDLVIEVGPGHGELTEKIRNERLDIRIIAIEKDKELAVDLKNKFKNCKNIEVIEGDALKILADLINNLPASPKLPLRQRSEASQRGERPTTNNYKIVGNIPYYITGYLLRIIGELKNKPSLTVLTIQKEVAQRICVKPPKMNLLAASVQFWAEPKIVDYILKKDFRPAPNVDSAIIKLATREIKYAIRDKKYYDFIKILFKQPRKTILNNLLSADLRGLESRYARINVARHRSFTIANYSKQNLGWKEEFINELNKTGIKPTDRPQNLSMEKILKLSQCF